MKIFDIHTHNLSAKNSLISVAPSELPLLEQGSFSVGIHPWHTDNIAAADIKQLRMMANRNDVYAIGECGIDKLRGSQLEKQEEIFTIHIELSEELRKPLIIHQVKSLQEIIFFKKEFSPLQPWLIHGFRSNAKTAKQLLDNGIFFSLGPVFQPETLQLLPMESLFLESDESLCFTELVKKVSQMISCKKSDLLNRLNENCNRLLGLSNTQTVKNESV